VTTYTLGHYGLVDPTTHLFPSYVSTERAIGGAYDLYSLYDDADHSTIHYYWHYSTGGDTSTYAILNGVQSPVSSPYSVGPYYVKVSPDSYGNHSWFGFVVHPTVTDYVDSAGETSSSALNLGTVTSSISHSDSFYTLFERTLGASSLDPDFTNARVADQHDFYHFHINSEGNVTINYGGSHGNFILMGGPQGNIGSSFASTVISGQAVHLIAGDYTLEVVDSVTTATPQGASTIEFRNSHYENYENYNFSISFSAGGGSSGAAGSAKHDFNGDTYGDVLWRNNSTGDTGYSDLHNGNSWHGLGASSTAYKVVGTGDFNADGYSDVLWRNTSTGDTGYSDLHNGNAWHGLGAASTAYAVVGTGDFNGDGFSDILYRNASSGDTGYSDLHNGNAWHGLGAASTAYSVVGTGDFNGDGFSDVLWRNNSSGDAGYSDLHNGNAWHGLGASSTAYNAVGTGDFNGDGFSDVLWRNNATGDTGYTDLHGGNAWHGLGASSTAYSVAAVGDYNGDGFSDLLYRNGASGDTGYYDLHNNLWHGLGAASTDYLVA
jgi:hypothetical protein